MIFQNYMLRNNSIWSQKSEYCHLQCQTVYVGQLSILGIFLGYKCFSNVVTYNNLFAHNGTGLKPSNELNLWSNTLQSMIKLQKYWIICENSGLHFIVRWFFRVTYSSHIPYDYNGNIFPEKLYVLNSFKVSSTTSWVDV